MRIKAIFKHRSVRQQTRLVLHVSKGAIKSNECVIATLRCKSSDVYRTEFRAVHRMTVAVKYHTHHHPRMFKERGNYGVDTV